jgi:thymidylate synthase (FAD)
MDSTKGGRTVKVAKQSVELIDSCGSDLSVVNAARVSFHKESDFIYLEGEYPSTSPWCCVLKDKDAKLIKYLATHNHKSPFNHAFMSFRVKAPIFVARQLVKHEYLPWNEVSRRYVDDEPEFYFPEYWRKKADNVKQGSSDDVVDFTVSHYNGRGDFKIPEWAKDHIEESLELYQEMLEQGVCAEQARMILPQNTMTEWIWSGTLFAFAKMCNLRLDSHTQKETQEIAKMIDKEAKALFPVSWKALMGGKHAT